MWGIMAINRGMWGISTWCMSNNQVELFETKEEAQKVADERNNAQVINRFTNYVVRRYKEY